MAARRTSVVAQVPDVRGRVRVRRSAANAVLRIGRVLERRAALGGIVDAERGRIGVRPGEIRDQRVVGVDQKERLGRQRGDHPPPALGDDLQLPVAIELIAEEVAEADHARLERCREVGQRSLVHLEQPQLGVTGRDERGRHAR